MSESPNNDGESPSSRSSSKYNTESPSIYLDRETQTRRSKRRHYGESPDTGESPSSEYDSGESPGGGESPAFRVKRKY